MLYRLNITSCREAKRTRQQAPKREAGRAGTQASKGPRKGLHAGVSIFESKGTVMTHRFTSARHLVHLTLIAGTLLVPELAPAIAAEEGTIPAQTVKYDDLNLATRQGAQTLYRRITAAAYEVCLMHNQDDGALKAEVARRLCVRNATQEAVAKIGNPLLTAIHEGTPPPGPLATVPTRRE